MKNIEKRRASKLKWNKNNPEKIKEYQRRFQEKKKAEKEREKERENSN